MGVHYINGDLLDATVDITEPEALVYELDAAGQIAGLVAHEYIVPIDAWTSRRPPTLFGMDFHRHPTLPLWVLHAWLWKDNPAGVFEDWNPRSGCARPACRSSAPTCRRLRPVVIATVRCSPRDAGRAARRRRRPPTGTIPPVRLLERDDDLAVLAAQAAPGRETGAAAWSS